MAPLAIAAIPAVLGAVGSYKSAKDAKKQAAKGVNQQSTTTRDPYAPAKPHIDAILAEAAKTYNEGQHQPMPYAWQNFLNNPTSPGTGSDPTYGGSPPRGAGQAPQSAPLTWKGKDQATVRAARQERRDARQSPQGASAGAWQPAQGQAAAASQGPSQPQFQPQQGPFGYSQGIRDYMMQQFQGPGVGGYQPAMNYIQQLLGGQSQNPMLSQAFTRASSYQPNNYFSGFLKK